MDIRHFARALLSLAFPQVKGETLNSYKPRINDNRTIMKLKYNCNDILKKILLKKKGVLEFMGRYQNLISFGTRGVFLIIETANSLNTLKYSIFSGKDTRVNFFLSLPKEQIFSFLLSHKT